MGKHKTEDIEKTQPFFVKVKSRFIPSENLFEVIEELETPTIQTPKFFKLYQREKHQSVKYQAQVKAQRMQSHSKNTPTETTGTLETPETPETSEITTMSNLEKPPIKISVIEDDPMMVIAIKMVMEEDPKFSVISASSTGEDGLKDVQNVQPDVILLDLGLPDASGLDIAKKIRDSLEIPIIIFSTSEKDEEVKLAFSIGANGYCVKGSDAEQLKTAIITVTQGNIYLDTKIAQAVIQQLNEQTSPEDSSTLSTWICPSGEVLKEQEIKILQLIADGQSNADISKALNLSVNTVKSYLKSIMQKMSAKNRTQLAVLSVRSGLT
jgi:DNA-binding NarL/FixJ family response regulator